MRYLLPVFVVAAISSSASAAHLPYYKMDSLAFLSSDIVLCDEIRYVKVGTPGGYEAYEATFTVVQTLKGTFRPKDELKVEVDLVYTREVMRWTGEKDAKPPAIPLGRALLFLTKDRGVWQPVGMKLIIEGETYCYGQFLSNPGPLWLARMAPENIDVPVATAYGEELLLKDLQAALEKAKGLTKATEELAKHDVIRKDRPPK